MLHLQNDCVGVMVSFKRKINPFFFLQLDELCLLQIYIQIIFYLHLFLPTHGYILLFLLIFSFQ